MMSATFIALVIILSVAVTILIIVPATKNRSDDAHGSYWFTIVIALLAGSSAIGLYALNSDWNWREHGLPDNPAVTEMYKVQRKIHDQPGSASAWSEAGKFYLQYQQNDAAVNAFNQAFQLSGGQNPDINLLLIDALALIEDPARHARISELISTTLKIAPDNRKALWYGGEIAFAQGKIPTAIARWQRLLDQTRRSDTEESRSVARLLTQRIEGARNHPPVTDSTGAAEKISVAVDLRPEWRAGLQDSSIVFVLARVADQAGPPLAVSRHTVSELPLKIELSDQNAMMANRKISDFESLEIVARIAMGGTPVAKSGDFFGAVKVGPGDSRDVQIIIDQVQP